MRDPTPFPGIGRLNEGSLHAALKQHYARPGDRFEVPLGEFVIDIVRPGLLIEIQTGSFAAMGRKLDHLLGEHRMLVVHPIAAETHLERPDSTSRRSPLRGTVHDLFGELVSLPTLLDHPNLEIEVAMVTVTKVQTVDTTARRGRGGHRTVDRRLRSIVSRHRFSDRTDLAALLPGDLPDPFTTADVSRAASIGRDAAQKMVYCLRALELVEAVGRTRAGILHRRIGSA